MHATAPDAATDFAAQFIAEIQLAQRDALQTIHKIMLHLTEGITGDKPPEDEDPVQARITTQRIRLCLQAARDILRLSHPGDASPPSPPTREKVAETWRGRMRGPSPRRSPRDSSLVAHTPCAAQQSGAEPEVNQRGLQDRHQLPSSPDSPASAPSPAPFTEEERRLVTEIMRGRGPFPPPLYDRLLEWSKYARATRTSHPLGIDPYVLVNRNPREPARSPA